VFSAEGALGGVSAFSRGLWLGLARAFPDAELVALVSRDAMPERLLDLIRVAPRHEIQPFGLSGYGWVPALEHRGHYAEVLRLIENRLSVAKWLNTLSLDVLHMLDQTPPPHGLSFPSMVTVHGGFIHVLRITHSRPMSLKEIAASLVARRLLLDLDRADLLVSISYATRDDVAQCFPHRFERFHVIPHGLDLDIFARRADGKARLQQLLPFQGDYFIHAGVLSDVKNPWGLIRAMKRVVQQTRQPIMLVNVGPYRISQANQRYYERVMALAQECGIEDRVVILDRGVSLEDMAVLYQNAVGLVFPSYLEGFGFPAVESLACGTPCVVARATSLPEMVGEWGILVDPHSEEEIADGMLRLLDDSSYRVEIREQGPRWAQRFSLETMATKYMELYRSLAK
jgi:glycosyltransferase involved in cell wall biosynthesis